MEIDPTEFSTWQQVAALGIVVLGAVLAKYLGTMKKDTAAVLSTLTTNNGGSHIKDQLDRVEQALTEHITWSEGYVTETAARLDAIEVEAVPEGEADYEPQRLATDEEA